MASQLCYSFHQESASVAQVYSRSINESLEAITLHSNTNNLEHLISDADFYLLCVSDSAIQDVAEQIASHIMNPLAIMAHTSGSTPVTTLSGTSLKNFGCFYPLQTIRKERKLSLRKVPLLIEGSNPVTIERLEQLGQIISDQVHYCSDQDRSKLHLPAVIVNNFVNQLYTEAYEYCQSEGLKFDYLYALIEETTNRILEGHNPSSVQTGPALRNDIKTINRHMSQLKNDKELLKTYQFMTEQIIKNRKDKKV